MIDDPYNDLQYLLTRLQKFIRKAEYWLSWEEMSVDEIDEISAYASRIRGVIYEFEREFEPSDEKKRKFADQKDDTRSNVLIFDFAPKIDELRRNSLKLDQLFHEVISAVKTVSSKEYLIQLSEKKLMQRYGYNNRRRNYSGSHRDRKNRPTKNVALTMSARTKDALVQIKRDYGIPMSIAAEEALWRYLHQEYPLIAQDNLQ